MTEITKQLIKRLAIFLIAAFIGNRSIYFATSGFIPPVIAIAICIVCVVVCLYVFFSNWFYFRVFGEIYKRVKTSIKNQTK